MQTFVHTFVLFPHGTVYLSQRQILPAKAKANQALSNLRAFSMFFVNRSPGPFSGEPEFPPVVFLLQRTCRSPPCPLPDSTPRGLGSPNLIPARSDGVCILLPSHLSLLPPLVYVVLTFSLVRSSLFLYASLLVCENGVQQSVSLH